MARARLLDTAERSETADHNPAQQNRMMLASSHLSTVSTSQAFSFPHRAGGLPRASADWEAPLDEGCICACPHPACLVTGGC